MKVQLHQLISFKTVSTTDNSDQFSKLFDYVNNQIKALNLIQRSFKSKNVISHLWSTDSNPQILLAAHVDVVPADDKQFQAIIKNGRLYGRGAIDMKFAVAVFISILNELPNLKTKSIGLLLTSDEEKGGQNGTKYVLQTSKLQPKLVLLPDAAPNMKVEYAEKGIWQIRLNALGQAAHAARPWLGQNAIDSLIDVYQSLKAQFPNPKTDQWQVTINVGKMTGGTATNVVAAEAALNLDIRFTNLKEFAQIKSSLNKLIKNKSITIEVLLEASSYYLSPDNKYLKQYLKVSHQVLGKKPELYQSAGASDARFYAEKGIPTILQSPLGGGQHSDDEWIDLKSLENYYSIVKNFLINLN